MEKYNKNLNPNVTCLLHMAIVYCAIATGDMIESHFSHSKQWMVGVPWEEALILALFGISDCNG